MPFKDCQGPLVTLYFKCGFTVQSAREWQPGPEVTEFTIPQCLSFPVRPEEMSLLCGTRLGLPPVQTCSGVCPAVYQEIAPFLGRNHKFVCCRPPYRHWKTTDIHNSLQSHHHRHTHAAVRRNTYTLTHTHLEDRYSLDMLTNVCVYLLWLSAQLYCSP